MYQKIIIAGHVGQDPIMKFTPDGKAVTTFSVAVNSGSAEKKQTAWFRVVVFGAQAETVEKYVHTGSAVLVEGRLQFDTATGAPKVFERKDQTWGSSFEVVADSVRFIGGKSDAEDVAV